jgi:hypothetical protein
MRLRPVLALLVASGLLLGAAACSSSSPSGGGTSTTTVAPEDVLVPNARVTAGLATLGTLVARAGAEAQAGADTVRATVDDAWSQWLEIEGRIKKNDTGAYLEFEDALSDMRVGAQEDDAAKVQKGATAVATLIASYLADFPG